MRRTLVPAGVMSAAVAGAALAGTPPPLNFGGSFDSQSSMGFLAVSHHGRITKVKHFQWDGAVLD